jgi:hypothetical protein
MKKAPLKATVFPDDTSYLPAHEATVVPGFHAYSQKMMVAPGETVDLRVNGEGPVDVKIVKHGRSVAQSVVVAELGSVEAKVQPIYRGSYVRVEKLQVGPVVTLEFWFRVLTGLPATKESGTELENTHPHPSPLPEGEGAGKRQARVGLVTMGGLGVWLEGKNTVTLIGEGGKVEGPEVSIKEWHHVIVEVVGSRAVLKVDAVSVGAHESLAWRVSGPVLMGAGLNEKGEASAFMTGDLCGVSVYAGILGEGVIGERFKTKETWPEPAVRIYGGWVFDSLPGVPFPDGRGVGVPYRDISGLGNHGRPVNVPIRMVPGPAVTKDSDWSTYDPARDKNFGFAVRFMSDANVDCRWDVACEWKVPVGMKQGQYAARLTNKDGVVRDVHFLVRELKNRKEEEHPHPSPLPTPEREGVRKKKAGMACFSTTSTRVAYNFQPFGDARFDYGCYQAHPSYPVLGQMMGQRRPTHGMWHTTTVDFELPFYAWLDEAGVEYDLYSEWDLEADPGLLEGYKVAAWAGHSEYWTVNQYERLMAFNKGGGHLFWMSGNTAFWRVSVDLEQSIIEVRKHDRRAMPGVVCDAMVNSAHHHQMDGWPGGYMRGTGYPEVNLIGVSTAGFTAPPLEGPREGWEVLEKGHWALEGVKTEGVLGDKGAGYETDYAVRAQLVKHEGAAELPVYGHVDGSGFPTAVGGDYDKGLTVLARAKVKPAGTLDYHANYRGPEEGDALWSDIVCWEVAPGSGRGLRFGVGSVLASHVLEGDENFAGMVRNVLGRMLGG